MSVAGRIKLKPLVMARDLAFEYISRVSGKSELKVFIPYRFRFRHPVYRQIYDNPPLEYSNFHRAKLAHCLQIKSIKKKNYLLEVFDHALTPFFSSRKVKKREMQPALDGLLEIYGEKECRKISLFSQGQKRMFEKWITDKTILDKITLVPLCWSSNMHIRQKPQKGREITFLFIASNFLSKGAEYVLRAWQEFCSRNKKGRLILVSHDIPPDMESRIERVRIIKQIPLSIELKDEIYSNSDVSIATTLTDGITPIEATSYGHPVIVFRAQHSEDFVKKENGILVDVPINFYDSGFLNGWTNFDDYLPAILECKRKGLFDDTIQHLVQAFEAYAGDKNLLKKHTKNAKELYDTEYDPRVRNAKLLSLYNELITK